jgi:hypothetical protein
MLRRRNRILPAKTNASHPSRFEPPKFEMFCTHVGGVPEPTPAPKSAPIQYGSVAASPAGAEENFAPSQFTSQSTPPHALPPAPVNDPPAPSGSHVPPDFYRHARLCTVCNHPERDAIEADFVRWQSPEKIAADYQIADRASIYRHAHATGLFSIRKRELPRVLESILECVGNASLDSMDTITRAARVYAHLDDNGKWFEPPKTMYILTGSAQAAPAPENHPIWSFR